MITNHKLLRSMESKEIASQLNTLLTRNYDSEKGYEQLSEKVDHPEMQSFFRNNYQERYRFGHELKDMMASYDVKPDKGSSTKADAHRAWINIKDALSLGSDKAVLEEAERGEQKAVDDYKVAIENPDLEEEHRRILSDHLTSIKNSQDQIAKLKTIV